MGEQMLQTAIKTGNVKTIENILKSHDDRNAVCEEDTGDLCEPRKKEIRKTMASKEKISGKKLNMLQRFVAGDIPHQIKSYRLAIVETLLRSGKFDLKALTPSQTLLHLLCIPPFDGDQRDSEENYRITKVLLEKNVGLNSKDDNGKTALMLACENGYTSIVQALLDSDLMKLDIHAVDFSGETALTMATRNKSYITTILLTGVLFSRAVSNRDVNTVARFLNYSKKECARHLEIVCVNPIPRRFQMNLLAFDSLSPSGSCISFYFWLKAVIIADNLTCRMMYDLLLTFEKVVCVVTDDGWAIFHAAMFLCQGKCGNGFNVDVTTNCLETVQQLACRYPASGECNYIKSEDIMRTILRQKVSVNQKNSFGQTALMVACENGNKVAVHELLKWQDANGNKIDVNAKGIDGQTALSMAQQSNNAEISKIIIQAMLQAEVENSGLAAISRFIIDVIEEYYKKTDTDQEEPDSMKAKTTSEAERNMHDKGWSVLLRRFVAEKNPSRIESIRSDIVESLSNSGEINVKKLTTYPSQILLQHIRLRAFDSKEDIRIPPYLLENNKDFNHEDDSGRPSLILECENKNKNMMQSLIRLTGENGIYTFCESHICNLRIIFLTLQRDTFLKDVERKNTEFVKSVLHNALNNYEEFLNSCNGKAYCNTKIWTYSPGCVPEIDHKTWIEAMHIAIEKSSEDILKLLLDYDELVQSQDIRTGDTVFHRLFEREMFGSRKQMLLIEALVESGKINVNAINFDAETVLHSLLIHWCYTDSVEEKNKMIILLLQHGVNVNHKDKHGNTPLMIASEDGHTPAVETILNWAKETGTWLDVDVKGLNGRTALMKAVMFKKTDATEMLLNAGASVNLSDNREFTALHYALHHGFCSDGRSQENVTEGISLLAMHCEKNLETRMQFGYFPRNCEELRIWKAPEELTGIELNKDAVKIIELLLNRPDIDVNALDCEGYSPLDIAEALIPKSPPSLFDALMRMGANLNIFHHENQQSKNKGDIENRCVNYLHRQVLATNRHISERGDSTSKCHILTTIPREMASGRDQRGRTPLHLAIVDGSVSDHIVEELISFGCKVNETDIYGRTPLHYAKSKRIRKLLLSNGTDSKIQDINGTAAIMRANILGKTKCPDNRLLDRLRDSLKIIDRNAPSDEGCKSFPSDIEIQWQEFPSRKSVSQKTWNRREYAYRHTLVNEITEEVKLFMDDLASEIKRRDPRFETKCMLVGSSYEGTKIDLPDEFDLDLVLTKISKLCEVYSSPELPSGFVHLKRKQLQSGEEDDGLFDNFFNENGILMTEKLNTQFKIKLINVLSDAQFIQSHLNFDWKWHDIPKSEEDIKRLEKSHFAIKLASTLKLKKTKAVSCKRGCFEDISIDIVPCIHIDGWWPDEAISNVREDIKAFGCNLVFDYPQRLFPWVPYSEFCSRISFAPAESEMIRRSSGAAKQAYMIGKHLASMHSFEARSLNTAYVLKTSFLYCIEAFTDAMSSEQELNLGELKSNFKRLNSDFWLENLMKCHLDFVLKDFCPCYFMPNFCLPNHDYIITKSSQALNYELIVRYFLAYVLYRSVAMEVSENCIHLSPLDPIWAHFDRKGMMTDLMKSAAKKLGTK